MQLLQKDNGRENRHRKNEHYPLEIVTSKPAREVQNQDDDSDDVKGVKHGIPSS
jgi:hypothetical protein